MTPPRSSLVTEYLRCLYATRELSSAVQRFSADTVLELLPSVFSGECVLMC